MSSLSRLFLAALAAGGLVLGAAAPAAAQGWGYGGTQYRGHGPAHGSPWAETPGLDRRQWRQEQWQRQGEWQGRISPRESWRIDRAQEGLRRHQAWARADGVVTREERWQLRRHADRVDGVIAESFDRDRRPHRGWGHRGW